MEDAQPDTTATSTNPAPESQSDHPGPRRRSPSTDTGTALQSSLRSKGFFWLATRPDIMGAWSQAGPMLALEPEGGNGNRKVQKSTNDASIFSHAFHF